MQLSRNLALPALCASLVLLGLVPFQNCGRAFKSAEKPLSPVQPGPNDGEQIAPPTKTRFYFGRSGGIDAIELNQGNGAVTVLPSAAFNGTQVGWLTYDKASNTMFAADAGNLAKLELFGLAAGTGRLNSTSVKNYVPGIVHLTAVPAAGVFHLFASNYNAGTASYYTLTNGTLNAGQTVSFGATAKAHSSAYDPSRQLVFIATLGLNKIQVFKLNGTTIAPAGEIAVDSPRTVVFDAQYDKLYVSTEAYTGTSFIKGYSIATNGAAYSFS